MGDDGVRVMVVVMTAILLSASASAAPQGRQPPYDAARLRQGLDRIYVMMADAAFGRADTNRDGRVDRREARTAAALMGMPGMGPDPRAWAALDLDRDGWITRSEMRTGVAVAAARTGAGRAAF